MITIIKKKKKMLPKSISMLWLNLINLFVVILIRQSVNGYNLSPKPNMVIRDPQFPTAIRNYESSYFGYSLNLRSKGWVSNKYFE